MFTRADALALDADDPLAFARARFSLPVGLTYLDGNSLGALPRRTATRVGDTIAREWGQGLVGSWSEWFGWPAKLGAKIARLIGAGPDEVIVTDNTSVNVFKLAAAALSLRPERRVIVTEAGNFPTDLYMLRGLGSLTDIEVRAVAPAEIAGALDEHVALLWLTHTHYRTGAVHDMAALTAAAHAKGALAGWDLSHSAGAVAVDLKAAQADLATGCGYKYLNGGPGAPAYAYVAGRHHEALTQPLTGWIGHAAPFDFGDDYAPARGVARLLTGTPGVLGLAALASGLATFDGIDMPAAAAKSRALGDLFLDLAAEHCPALEPACPREGRGAQVSLRHPHAEPIMQALIARGVVGDVRPPDVLRFGFPALYTRYVDVWDGVEALAQVLESGEWQDSRFAQRRAVT
ncbi:kynureninase [Glacieibacterium frigidum]|uniref:Kynureninase n=1 Tax=Glacieibacterium frigidum TaxID=2593303 RepID=A0A552UHW0_9SPHN|nr:kynureninase [Glacieibacterium frigidum]TRW17780.1 kynureninase [Glacieibacterium frigidum]